MKIQKRPCKHLLSVALSILTSALPLHGSHKPNVVFILIDDISHYGVSAYGAKQLNSTEGLFESDFVVSCWQLLKLMRLQSLHDSIDYVEIGHSSIIMRKKHDPENFSNHVLNRNHGWPVESTGC